MSTQTNIPRLPKVSYFVAIKRAVMRGSEAIAHARSHTMARRIAEALNRYRPGPKGY